MVSTTGCHDFLRFTTTNSTQSNSQSLKYERKRNTEEIIMILFFVYYSSFYDSLI